MYILGISCWYHDSAAALLKDGNIIAASEEERFTRQKHDFSFPINVINFCLDQAGIKPADIDYVVFYDKPIIKFERIIASILKYTPKSAGVFREAIPLWLKTKLKFQKKIKKTLNIEYDKVLFSKHHHSHGASSFLVSPFKEAAILNIDGVGEQATASLGYGKNNAVKIKKEMHFPHSYGLLYSAFTAFLGFRVNNGEYKVMGMAPYGNPKYLDKIEKVATLNPDGSLKLNMNYFSFPYSTKKTYTSEFTNLFGKPKEPGSLFYTSKTKFPVYLKEKPPDYKEEVQKNQYYADIAASIQKFLEISLLKIARYLKTETDMDNLCYAGGVALNSKANAELVNSGIFKDIYIQPASTDAGGALGAALWCWHVVLDNKKRHILDKTYLGKSYSQSKIIQSVNRKELTYSKLNDKNLFKKVSSAIASGKVIAWYQGRTEWGPRALGNRSILADPRDPKMKNKVNRMIKFREPYRPFAPSILKEDVDDYVLRKKEIYPDKFMLVTYKVRKEKQKLIPAVTHINKTSRIQSVDKTINPRYWKLINTFKKQTGIGLLLNTSFNLKGEPIVNSPEDAVKTFLKSGLGLLVMNNYLITKES